ncbi:MAG: cadherin domain-containing protein [Thiotrichaceae bacterium]
MISSKTFFSTLSLLMTALLSPVTTFAEGQLTSEIEEVILQQYTDYDDLVLGQKAQDNLLVLTPDSSFFFPKGPKLIGEIASTIPGADLNQDKSYSKITEIDQLGQKIIWPMMPASNGQVSVDVYMEASAALAGATLSISLGDMNQQVTVVESDGLTPQPWNLTANIIESGVSEAAVQNLEIVLINLNSVTEAGYIHKIKVQGTPLNNGYLLRARWRPSAIHSKFLSAELDATGLNSQAWVMEVKPDYSHPDVFEFYAPLTTGFGYYGSYFKPHANTPANDFTSGGINFSFWSFGREDPKPPLLELSHLLSVGKPFQIFDGFDHEGTGVKPRGFEPWAGHILESTVFAIKFEPAVENAPYQYKTYTSYYLDPVSREWKLYAAGRKYFPELTSEDNNLRLPSTFVEVLGGPTKSRTGQIPRTADYRGWVQDTSGAWHPVSQMKAQAVPTTTPKSKTWTSSGNGWLRMTMGGMIQKKYKSGSLIVDSVVDNSLPDYMAPEKLAALDAPLVTAEINDVVLKADGNLELDFTLTGIDEDAEVKLYYGDEDALTLIYENHKNLTDEWDEKLSTGYFSAGRRILTIPPAQLPNITSSGYCRLLVESAKGRYWSRETSTWAAGNTDNGFWASASVSDPVPTLAVIGTQIGSATVNNPEQYASVTYSILSGNEDGLFTIDPSTGVISVAGELPQVGTTYALIIQADIGASASHVIAVNINTYLTGNQWKIYEPFDQGSDGESLLGVSSGSGWSSAWSGDSSWTLQSAGLSFAGVDTAGLKAKVGDQNSIVSRNFNQSLEIGDATTQLPEVWISSLIDMVAPVKTGHAVEFRLTNNGSEIGYFGKKQNGSLGFQLGGSGWQEISGDLGSGSGTVGTWLFVLHLKADGSGNVIASLHAAKSTEVGVSPVLSDLTHVADATLSGSVELDGVELYRYNNTDSAIDEITITAYNPYDRDNDGVDNATDNCPVAPNADQLNTDNDTEGNACDDDDDNDQIPDDWELANGLNPLDASDAATDNDRDGMSNLDEYLAGSNPNDTVFTWDIDGDGTVKPLTDGLLNLRYHFGFRGNTLIENAIDNNATRSTPADIEAYISGSLSEGDLDGDGVTKPLTDGLLLLRYLFGFRGDTLIQNAIDSGATRQSAADIEAYTTERMP